MKKILIINGNPVKESYSMALAEAYRKGAEKSGAEIKMISLIDFDFGTPFLKDFKTPNDSRI
jgi:NAD(P)H dehydrogenase (quinone)